MARPAISVLLVAVLLLCPLGCFLRQTLGSVVSPSAPVAGCCSHCRPEQSPEAPAPRQDDSGGRCCLCEGALHDGPSRAVEVDLHADDLAGFLILPAETVALSGHALPTVEHLLGPPETAGRALRTRLASLLL